MSSLVDEFDKLLGKKKTNDELIVEALKIIIVCREYLDNHYKKSVYGNHQKGILDRIDTFLESIEDSDS